MIFLRINLP